MVGMRGNGSRGPDWLRQLAIARSRSQHLAVLGLCSRGTNQILFRAHPEISRLHGAINARVLLPQMKPPLSVQATVTLEILSLLSAVVAVHSPATRIG
jgi:hypothetical protein